MGGRHVLIAGLVSFAVFTGFAGLSGCSGSGADVGPRPAGVSPPVSASPSPSTLATAPATLSPEEARARIPKAAREHTFDGAVAFAWFYMKQSNRAWTVPDPELIRPYALDSCKSCANVLRTAEWLAERHLRYDAQPMRLAVPIPAPESKPDHVYVEMVANQEKRHIVDAQGTVHESIPFRGGGAQVEVVWRNDGWAVAGIRAILS